MISQYIAPILASGILIPTPSASGRHIITPPPRRCYCCSPSVHVTTGYSQDGRFWTHGRDAFQLQEHTSYRRPVAQTAIRTPGRPSHGEHQQQRRQQTPSHRRYLFADDTTSLARLRPASQTWHRFHAQPPSSGRRDGPRAAGCGDASPHHYLRYAT